MYEILWVVDVLYKIVCVFIVFKILIYFGYKFNYKIINKCLVGFILINLIWLSLFVDVCIIILFFFFDVIEDFFDWCLLWCVLCFFYLKVKVLKYIFYV